MNRDYENMIIVKPDLEDNEREEIFDKISKRIKDLDGEVLDSKVWIKERKFYYFLRSRGAEKKKYYKGCYWLINFTLDTEKLPELKETMRLEERILRNLIVNKEGKIKPELTSQA